MTKRRKKVSARAFQRQVLAFVGATLLVLIVVLYFSFSRTVITVTPKIEKQTITIELTVGPASSAVTNATTVDLAGTVITMDLERTKTVSDLSQKEDVPARAGGRVTFINQWTKTQPLQAGTRLLSQNGVLFRTTERVDIPAGGSVETTILADEPGTSGEVPPGTFIIVALWEGLKSQIYAESTEAFTGGTVQQASVSQQDLTAARTAALEDFRQAAQTMLDAKLAMDASSARLHVAAILPNITQERSSAKLGDTVSTFDYVLKGSAVGVAVDETALATLVTTDAAKRVAEHHRLLRVQTAQPAFSVVRADPEQKTATIKTQVVAETILRSTSPIFSPQALTGMDRQEIDDHFNQFDEVQEVSVRFSPFWVLRAPRLPDHIKILLKEPVN
ncbi:MAG: baseplate J/gp47 family protein [bacterium]